MKKNFKTTALLLNVISFLFLAISCKENKSDSNYNDQNNIENSSNNNQNEEDNVENISNMQNESKEEFDINKYLSGNSFSVNGNGSVSFNILSSGNGSIMINGNGNTLEGQITITSNSSFSVRDLMVTGGNYDASNNSSSYGSFTVNSNGDLSGSLSDRNGNSKNVTFVKSN